MTDDEFFNPIRDVLNPHYLCVADAGVLKHRETHHDGSTSEFRLIPSSKMLAFTLDKAGRNPFDILASGCDLRNDLTIVCRGQNDRPLVFVIECKRSGSPLHAQRQIEHGVAFCEYLLKLVHVGHGTRLNPRFMGVVAYRPKQPAKGTTRPQFKPVGRHDLLRAEWHYDTALPLRELVNAAEALP
jgi:hypothetical protein